MAKKTHIALGDDRLSIEWLKGITEHTAIETHRHIDPNRMRNAWKQANGFSVPNYSEDKKETKKTSKKKNSSE